MNTSTVFLAPGTSLRTLPRAYTMTWLSTGLGLATAGEVLSATGMRIALNAGVWLIALSAMLIVLHFYYAKVRSERALALATGGLGLFMVASIAGGTIAHAGLRLRHPDADALLNSADRIMGFDTMSLAMQFLGNGTATILLTAVYHSTFPLCVACLIGFCIARDERRMWNFLAVFATCLIVFACISIYVPALGNLAYHCRAACAASHVMASPGMFHLGTVAYFRDGVSPLLDITRFNGVVTFPSFHLAMALTVAYSLGGFGRIGILAWLWAASVAVSTVPIGGHYVIDLIAGALLWAACAWICCEPAQRH